MTLTHYYVRGTCADGFSIGRRGGDDAEVKLWLTTTMTTTATIMSDGVVQV